MNQISDNEQSISNIEHNLPPLHTVAIKFFINETINKLIIQNNGKSELNPLIKIQSLKKRLQHLKHERIFAKNSIQLKDSYVKKLLPIKLSNDVGSIIHSLDKIQNEMVEKSTFTCLSKLLNYANTEHNQENDLLKEYIFNKSIVNKLNTKLQMIKDLTMNLTESNNIKNLKNKDNLFDGVILSSIQKRFSKNYDDARFIQYKKLQDDKVKCLEEKYYEYIYKKDIENKICTGINETITKTVNNVQNETEYWMNKFDIDMEHIEVDTEIANDDLLSAQKRNHNIKILYEAREKFIADYKQEQLHKTKNEQLAKDMLFSAIKLQAWWRGTMVRNHLGRYKLKIKRRRRGSRNRRRRT